MKLSEFGEDAFLRELRARYPPRDDVPVGIGDDTAALVCPAGELLLLTVDTLVEGTHFTLETLPPRFIGRKAVAVSASDIAAMGGSCVGALLSLVVPGELDVEMLWEIVGGASERAEECGMPLVGGNLSRTSGPLVVDVAVAGGSLGGRVLRRDRARPGDGLFVSGKLGAAACGLVLLKKGAVLSASGSLVVDESLRHGPLALAEECLRAQMDPSPRLELGQRLNRGQLASSCLDLSDGLSLDLARLCRASRVRARVEESRLPLSPGVLAWERSFGRDPLELALSGGEDYELLFTARAEDIAGLYESSGLPVTRIGEIVAMAEAPDEPVELIRRDGSSEPLTPRGWDHFRYV